MFVVNGMRMIQTSCIYGALRTSERFSNRITVDELKQYFLPKAVDNKTMATVCDKGYLHVFRLFYRINRMDQYKNFVVVVLDEDGYNVIVLCVCFA